MLECLAYVHPLPDPCETLKLFGQISVRVHSREEVSITGAAHLECRKFFVEFWSSSGSGINLFKRESSNHDSSSENRQLQPLWEIGRVAKIGSGRTDRHGAHR